MARLSPRRLIRGSATFFHCPSICRSPRSVIGLIDCPPLAVAASNVGFTRRPVSRIVCRP
eukprot:2141680-Heterocapsa_arctica.AAC.1